MGTRAERDSAAREIDSGFAEPGDWGVIATAAGFDAAAGGGGGAVSMSSTTGSSSSSSCVGSDSRDGGVTGTAVGC
jgi:hypothetical protein